MKILNKKNIILIICSIVVGLLISFLPQLSRQAHAEDFIGSIVESLKEKLGFSYLVNSSLPYIFSKDTPNYRAFAGDRATGGDHSIMIEKNGVKIGLAFLSASPMVKLTPTVTPSIIPENTQESSSSAGAFSNPTATDSANPTTDSGALSANASAAVKEQKELLNQIEQGIKNINTGLTDLSEKIDTLKQDVNRIVSKAKLVEGKKERKVSFDDILIDIDMVYRLNESGISQEINLKNKDKIQNSFIFSLSPDDLSYRNLGHDIWYFYDETNFAVIRIPKSYAKDAKGNITSNVSVKIEKINKKNQLIIAVPPEWLESTERVYPVKIYSALEIIPEKRTGYKSTNQNSTKKGLKIISNSSESATISEQPASPTPEISPSGSVPTPSEVITPIILSPTPPETTPSIIPISPDLPGPDTGTVSGVLINTDNLPNGLSNSMEKEFRDINNK
jgi:hypothetical protein